MTSDTAASPARQTPDRSRTRLAGTAIERYGWVLVALLAAFLLVMGVTGLGGGDARNAAIDGSGCCTGRNFAAAPQWTFAYLEETFRYQATFETGMALFSLAVLVFGSRRGATWAWAVSWYWPVMFVFHSVVLGSGTFDVITCAIVTIGQLLMIRPVFGRRVPVPPKV